MAAMIPPQLCTEEYRFNLVQSKNKKAIELGWTTNANYAFDDPKLKEHLARGGNYGVLCGYAQLGVLDADSEKLRDWVQQNLPETFTIKTSKGAHFYYTIPKLQKKIILKLKEEHFGEIQFKGQYVVGPTCTHSTGVKYEILNDTGITELDEKMLNLIIEHWTDKPEKNAPPVNEVPKKRITRESSTTAEYIKQHVSLIEVLQYYGVNTSRSPTNCPLHSDTTPSFSFDNGKGLWKCHTEGIGGDIIKLVELKENCSFKEALAILAERYGLETKEERETERDADSERFSFQQSMTQEQRDLVRQLQVEALEWLGDKKPRISTECVVRAFKIQYKVWTIRDDKGHTEMYIYQDGVYLPNGMTYVGEFTRRTYGKAFVQALLSEVLLKIKTDTYINPENFFDSAPVKYIPLVDGIYDIEADRMIPFDHNIIFLRKLPVKHTPGADCPEIKKFLKQILANEEDFNTMQEVFGYFLLRQYWLEKSIMMLGKGSNGKTVLLELMRAFLGDENVSSVSLMEIEKDQYSVSTMLSKLANLAGDIGNQPIEDSQMFKKLTGRDKITANRKHLPHVEFENYAKLVFACNELPDSFDDSDGFWRRWVFFNFPNRFVPKEQYDRMDEAEKEKARIADPFIVQKLTTPEELDGLFNWALAGLKRLQANRSFSDKRGAAQLRELWKRKANSFFAFLEDEVTLSMGRCIRESNMMAAYTAYCRRHEMPPTSEKSMKYQLRKFGANYERRLLNPPSDAPYERDYFWTGIVFKRDDPRGQESLYKQPIENQNSIIRTLPVLPKLPVDSHKVSHEMSQPIILEQVAKMEKLAPEPITPEFEGQNSGSKWSMKDVLLKSLKWLHRQSQQPVDHFELVRVTREQGKLLGLFRFSDDVFESQFDDNIQSLKNMGEIAEVQPARYVPL